MPAITDSSPDKGRLPRWSRVRLLAPCLTTIGLVLAISPAGAPAQGSDIGQGAKVLAEVNADRRDCSELDDADFEAVGEFMMERMLGSSQAHEGMDRMMDSMMGSGGLDQMHRFMGQRLAGCDGGTVPGGYGGMMGMMGMMGGGMMGGGYGPGSIDDGDGSDSDGHGPGMMFGQASSSGDEDDDDWGIAALMSFVMLALLGVIAYWLFSGRGRASRTDGGALAILDRRLAAGEIDGGEYERRRGAIQG